MKKIALFFAAFLCSALLFAESERKFFGFQFALGSGYTFYGDSALKSNERQAMRSGYSRIILYTDAGITLKLTDQLYFLGGFQTMLDFIWKDGRHSNHASPVFFGGLQFYPGLGNLSLSLAYALDRSLSTSSIILIGVIFTMFISSIISLLITFCSDHTRSLSYWTLGSFSGVNYDQVKLLFLALLLCGGILFRFSPELNAFAISEDNARHIGVNVKRVKLIIMITVSVLIGVCVSISGTVSFVGLVMPHIARMLVGPNHKRLLPASLFSGAIFLLLADLVARTLLSPIELSIGVVTSMVGAVAFVIIFNKTRKAR